MIEMCRVSNANVYVTVNLLGIMVVPAVMCETENWGMGVRKRNNPDVMGLICLRNM